MVHGLTQREPDDSMQRLRDEPGYIGALLRRRARATDTHTLVFVDQFEELYTLVADADVRRAFTSALVGIADDAAAPLRVVVSMRADFVDRVTDDPRFADELSRGLLFLSTPDSAGLREALVQPIDRVGYRFETQAIVDDMLVALAGTPGALPLLQFAASQLWDARDRDRRLVTSASYTAIGGLTGALAMHADAIVAGMNAAAQKLTPPDLSGARHAGAHARDRRARRPQTARADAAASSCASSISWSTRACSWSSRAARRAAARSRSSTNR